MLTNSRIPSSDNSLPKPERPMPPKGSLGSEATKLFIAILPDSINSVAIYSPFTKSFVNIAPANPYRLSLAILMASLSSCASIKVITGPNSSSWLAFFSLLELKYYKFQCLFV